MKGLLAVLALWGIAGFSVYHLWRLMRKGSRGW